MSDVSMPGEQAQDLLETLSDWGTMVTIIIHAGSVFEFKGPFPKGKVAEGFYNLSGPVPGLHGHLNLKQVKQIRFQDKPHRGRESYAFVFENADDEVIFKVFLGRDEKGELLAEQKQRFLAMQQHYQ
jgi:heme iron utilization protein